MNQSNLHRLSGIVERVTFHSVETGWSVIKVSPFDRSQKLVTVVIHQAKIFAGSSMEFWGTWCNHPKHGEQFKAEKAIEKKPANTAALEKYLGSGLIKGVGPQIAKRIVKFFKDETLTVFEEDINRLMNVPGIAEKKLSDIKHSWQEHKSIRDVMLFLQGHGISTLFAVKIYKAYGNKAIKIVSENPYKLAKDIYGIGFFSADKIALSMGFERDSAVRIEAGIKHVLAASREDGHCYLTEVQILENTVQLLELNSTDQIFNLLTSLLAHNEIKKRMISSPPVCAYYSNSLFFDEQSVATKTKFFIKNKVTVEEPRIKKWVETYCDKFKIQLSSEQQNAIVGISSLAFSILTGGPGCGKTTTIKVLVKLLLAMNKKTVLAAPTGRAAQRMSEVIGLEAKTIHRLLEWAPDKGGFKKSEEDPLLGDFFIFDECSMLDINLAASLLKAIPAQAQILLIGDPDQLPSVGAGNVLHDLLETQNVPRFELTKIFRQAEGSLIIRYAHQMNKGDVPQIESPFHRPELWKEKVDCLFVDAEEATQEQLHFIHRAKHAIGKTLQSGMDQVIQTGDKITGIMKKEDEEIKIEKLLVQEFFNASEIQAPLFNIPQKFKHIDLEKLSKSPDDIESLKTILKSVHPWSALHYGLTGLDVVLKLYTDTIPKYFGNNIEIQILTPQQRGSLGAINLNSSIQTASNPASDQKRELKMGDRIFREGDRVIQTRNNYDLGVFNGDIGKILKIDLENYQCLVQFGKHESIVYEKEDLLEISLAYSITIHKSQGSEFDVVIIPITTQHFKMLFRNLIYTGLTRAKKLCVFVGSRKALALAVKQINQTKRQTALTLLIEDVRVPK